MATARSSQASVPVLTRRAGAAGAKSAGEPGILAVEEGLDLTEPPVIESGHDAHLRARDRGQASRSTVRAICSPCAGPGHHDHTRRKERSRTYAADTAMVRGDDQSVEGEVPERDLAAERSATPRATTPVGAGTDPCGVASRNRAECERPPRDARGL
jgi:hypothetical protein